MTSHTDDTRAQPAAAAEPDFKALLEEMTADHATLCMGGIEMTARVDATRRLGWSIVLLRSRLGQQSAHQSQNGLYSTGEGMTAPQDKTLLPVELCRRLRATGGGGQGGSLKVEAADLIEAQQATIARLVEALEAARFKLGIYRSDREGKRGGEYSGGMEYAALVRVIDAARVFARSSAGDVKP